jgi:hypothetical protein
MRLARRQKIKAQELISCRCSDRLSKGSTRELKTERICTLDVYIRVPPLISMLLEASNADLASAHAY